MTVTTTAAKSGPYTGNASTVAFPFTFEIESASEVQVLVDGAEVASSAYSVTLSSPGGTVTFTTAPASGTEILILSDPSFLQDISFENNGAFLPEVHDEANDRSAIRDIYLLKQFDRVPRVPIGEALTELPAAASRASKLLGFNSAGGISLTPIAQLSEMEVPAGFVRPEDYGGGHGMDNRTALQQCYDVAESSGAIVLLTGGGDYYLGGQVRARAGTKTMGPRSAVIKRIDQVSTTTTSAISAGGTSITFTVSSTAGFAVGQSIMFVWNAGANILPNNPYLHTDIEITAIAGDQITALRNGHTGAVPSGATLRTAGRLIVQEEGSVLELFTIDGNAAGQTEGYWISHIEVVQDGSNCIRRGIHFKDSYSDAVLVGGPEGGHITGSWDIDCLWTNIGSNCVHYGNVRRRFVINPEVNGSNKLKTGINVAHNDGAFIDSNDCLYLSVMGGSIEDALTGVGAVGSNNPALEPVVSPNLNDEVRVIGTRFKNCFRDIEITLNSRRIVIGDTQHDADYTPAGAQPFNNTYASHTAIWLGGDEHGQHVHHVTASNVQIKNGAVTVLFARHVDLSDLQFDNREVTNSAHLLAAYRIISSRDIKISGGRVVGGHFGLYIQSSYALSAMSAYGIPQGLMRRLRFEGIDFIDQASGAVDSILLAAGGEIGAIIKNCQITDAAIEVADEAAMLALNMPLGTVVKRTDLSGARFRLDADPYSTLGNWTSLGTTWFGINLKDKIRALQNDFFCADEDRGLINVSRRYHNGQGNNFNEVNATDFGTTFTPYASTTHVINDGGNVAVSDLGSGVYEVTKDAGGDANNGNANTTTYVGDADWDLEIEPMANGIRGIIGLERGDQTDATTSDFDFAINFFDGNLLAWGGFSDLPTSDDIGNYVANDKVRLGMRNGVLSARQGGTTFDNAPTILWTSPNTYLDAQTFRLRTSLRTVGGVWRIKLFG